MKRIIYRIYQLCIAVPLGLLATLLTAIVTIIGSTFASAHFWGYYPGKLWSKFLCHIFLLPVRIQCHPAVSKEASYVFVANHQGAFDIFLIYGFLGRNFKWMMKKSLRNTPFIGKACEAAGHIFVDKSGPKKVQETIERARNVLQNGTSLVVFPEGARTWDGEMISFKKGAFQLANDLKLPIVPITINGSFKAYSRKATWVTWSPLTLTIHEPIYPTIEGFDIKATMNEAYNIIREGLAN